MHFSKWALFARFSAALFVDEPMGNPTAFDSQKVLLECHQQPSMPDISSGMPQMGDPIAYATVGQYDRGMLQGTGWDSTWLFLAGVGNTGEIWIRYLASPNPWTSWTSIGGNFTISLDILRINETIHFAAITTTGSLLTKSFNTTSKTYFPSQNSWIYLDNYGFQDTVTIASHDNLTLSYFVRGQGNNLYHKFYTPANQYQSPLTNLGGNFSYSPDSLSAVPGPVDVFATGADKNIYTKRWKGSWDSTWTSLGGGTMIRSPTAINLGSRVDVFGITSNGGAVYTLASDSNTWNSSAWVLTPIQSGVLNSVSAAWWSNGGQGPWLEVYGQIASAVLEIRAVITNNKLTWYGPWNQGGVLAGTLTTFYWGGSRLDNYGVNPGGASWYLVWTGGAWTAWTQFGSSFKA
jgi:hypothetical protein